MSVMSDERAVGAVAGGGGVLIPPGERAHDGFSLDELASSYNFRVTSSFHPLFARLLVKEARLIRERLGGGPVRALNVGCGIGIGRSTALLQGVDEEIDEHWGIEPDEGIEGLPLFENFQHATVEGADLPEGYFDLVYSGMVVEHVADPEAFMGAIARCLKPGGTHLFMTVNGSHYFARLSWAMNRTGLEDFVLRLVKGKQAVEGYHYPVQYRMNTQKQLRELGDRYGFDEMTSAFVESVGPAGYLPGPLRPLLWAMNAKRRVVRSPGSLLTLICRMRKAGG